MSDQLITILTVAGALGAGLVAGVMLAFSTLVMGGLRELPAAEGIRAMQRINAAAPRPIFMLAFIGTGLICLALLIDAAVHLDQPGAVWRLIGAVLYLLAVVITGGFNIPRNKALDGVDPQAPEAGVRWQKYLAEWMPGNHLRLLTAAAGSVVLVVSLLAA